MIIIQCISIMKSLLHKYIKSTVYYKFFLVFSVNQVLLNNNFANKKLKSIKIIIFIT